MFKLVRDFLPPEIYLGFDANNGYSVSTAIQQGRRFEALGIDHFEEPGWRLALHFYDEPTATRMWALACNNASGFSSNWRKPA